MSDTNTVDIHGLVDLNGNEGKSLETHMHQVCVITDREKPTSYSELEYFTRQEWDEYPFSTPEEMKWWMDGKYGMFIHWGPCSVIGAEIGWSRGGTRGGERPGNQIPLAIYDNLYRYFNPQRFDADAWVSMAKKAGFKYIIFITKHHDGFCMWDTKTTDYNIMNGPYGKDILKQLSQACAAQNMPLGLYFSQRDWYHPDYFTENHQNYTDYMVEQVRELLTGYGKISVLWFDAWYPSLFTAQHWNGLELCREVKKLQPGVIINNRCSLPGDFDTPEGVIGSFQVTRPWETTTSVHASWSWHPDTYRTVKSFKECLDSLIGSTIGGGNLLFNAGPRPDGVIEPEIVERFTEVGNWLAKYGESVYGTRGGPLPAGGWGGYCAKENRLYVHILYGNKLPCQDDWLCVALPEGDILSVQCLTAETDVRVQDGSLYVPVSGLNPDDTVICVEYRETVPVVQADPRNGRNLV